MTGRTGGVIPSRRGHRALIPLRRQARVPVDQPRRSDLGYCPPRRKLPTATRSVVLPVGHRSRHRSLWGKLLNGLRAAALVRCIAPATAAILACIPRATPATRSTALCSYDLSLAADASAAGSSIQTDTSWAQIMHSRQPERSGLSPCPIGHDSPSFRSGGRADG